MSDLSQLSPKQAEQDVVSVLDDALERAKSGELKAIAVIGLKESGSVHYGMCVPDDHFKMVGALENAKLMILKHTQINE